MQAKAITPTEYALETLKASLSKANDMLYGTPERAQRSISLSFLALVLLQMYGLLGGTGPCVLN
jgi:hypothetical protein